ncbi:DUF305 domain-containing protein [Actinocorallia sp. B10E7]|uniref:DUF305 domain-containing protein n=1 Tax=Actinocorallia sp. B10E7 TaxID=3153558 RepID=UPI00325C489A
MIVKFPPVRRTVAVLALTTAVALGAAACGDDSSEHGMNPSGGHPMTSAPMSPSMEAGRHNAQDVAFAQGMIPHHRQAVEMADLAATRAGSQQVKDLAAKIKAAQDPEITTMSGWLTAWGEQVPADGMHGMDHGTGHPGQGMPGMMSETDMAGLAKLSGTGFDTRFLKMMIAHHEGAVTMATTEKSEGAYGPAKDLAASIITGQSTEIDQMKKLLGE